MITKHFDISKKEMPKADYQGVPNREKYLPEIKKAILYFNGQSMKPLNSKLYELNKGIDGDLKIIRIKEKELSNLQNSYMRTSVTSSIETYKKKIDKLKAELEKRNSKISDIEIQIKNVKERIETQNKQFINDLELSYPFLKLKIRGGSIEIENNNVSVQKETPKAEYKPNKELLDKERKEYENKAKEKQPFRSFLMKLSELEKAFDKAETKDKLTNIYKEIKNLYKIGYEKYNFYGVYTSINGELKYEADIEKLDNKYNAKLKTFAPIPSPKPIEKQEQKKPEIKVKQAIKTKKMATKTKKKATMTAAESRAKFKSLVRNAVAIRDRGGWEKVTETKKVYKMNWKTAIKKAAEKAKDLDKLGKY